MREGWKEVKFETLLEIPLRNGINRPSRVRGKGYKMVNMGELFANDRLQNIEMELVQLNASEQENFQIKNFDLLFARQSIVAEGAGKCSIVLEIDDINCFESHLIRARINQKNSALFYYYLFQSAYGKGLLSTIRQQGVQAGIRGSDLQKLKIICPPLETQRKIASILSGYDDLIENNLKRIKILEEMAQQTYEEWFVRLRFPGYEIAEIDDVTGLPEGWEKVKLRDVCDLVMGQSPKSEHYNDEGNGLPFHQGVKDYGFRFPVNNSWSTSGNKKAVPNSILFSVRAPVGRLNVASEEIILGRGLAAINHKDGLNSYLYYQLRNIFFEDNLIGGGAIYASVTKNDVERIGIISAGKIAEHFNKYAFSIDREILNLTSQNQRLREARDLLLPRLMMGIVEV